ncbi:MAG: RecQ family ATP-dependent DNA helicase, partial [Blastocatellia bacterium]|nr:RecQ family ATP-dependent DNA helicase [Blastocatellia bacterium]
MPTLDDAQSALERHFGFSRFREGQSDVIEAVLTGQDVIVVMPTGGGKSLCYQLPALLFPGVTLVVSPLIALMKDQVDALGARDIAATYVNSSLSYEDQLARLRGMSRGEYRLVYIAPERFRNARFVESLRSCRVSLFAVDEAHCISQWGHDFRPDYLRLREAAEALANSQGRPPLIALTATATPQVRSDIAAQLGLKKASSFVAGFDRHNLTLRVEPCKSDNDRLTAAYQIVKRARGSGIIYCSTRKAVDDVSGKLQRLGLTVGAYHAGLDEAKRARMQDYFMAGDLDAIVATNAFGMGVDKSDIRFVTHYNLPGSIEAYYQEVGRAGRDGLPSLCTLLFNYVDTRTHEFFIDGSYPPRGVIEQVYACLLGLGLETIHLSASALASRVGTRNEISINSALIYLEKAGHIARQQGREPGIRMIDRAPVADLRVDWNDIALHEATERHKLREMVNFAYYERCLRQFILRYFGDRKEAANCRCSNCQPKLKWGGAAPVQQKPGRKPSPEREPASETATVTEAAPQSIGMMLRGGPRPLSDDEHLVARKILSCIARMEGKFGKGMVASVLRGVKAKNIVANELDQLSTYGLLNEHSQDDLTRFINALIVADCVRQTGGAVPTVSLTTLGGAVMRDQARVELDLEAVEADTSDEEIVLPPNYSETQEQTFALYRQGLGIDEIAEKRNLKPSTIEMHLAALIEEGREINLSDLVNDEDRALIEAAASKAGLEGLRPIKDQLPERIGYAAIRLVIADIKRRQKSFIVPPSGA